MNGSMPEIASTPVAPWAGRKDGGRPATKSATSCPVHLPASSSHQTSALRSLQGLPSGSAEARLYKIRRFRGHAQPHSGATQLCSAPGLVPPVGADAAVDPAAARRGSVVLEL